MEEFAREISRAKRGLVVLGSASRTNDTAALLVGLSLTTTCPRSARPDAVCKHYKIVTMNARRSLRLVIHIVLIQAVYAHQLHA